MPAHDIPVPRPEGPGRSLIGLGSGFLLLAAVSVGYLLLIFAPQSRAEALSDWESRLMAMANDRQVAIERWVADVYSDARTLAQYPTVRYILAGRVGPPYPFDPEQGAEEHLHELFGNVIEVHDYAYVALVDSAGALTVGSGNPTRGGEPLGPLTADVLEGEGRLDLRTQGERPVVVAAEPVVDTRAARLGAIVIETEAERFLHPLLRQRPFPSRTAETLLVTRRGGELTYISPLRKTDTPPGDVRSTTTLLEAMSADTAASVGRYTDYARAEVIAVTRPITGAPWTLVAKVDVDEALADYRRGLASVVAAIFGLLIGALGVVFGLWRWHSQRLTSRVLREQARFAAVLDNANDPIFFLDTDGRIIDANRRATEFYGIPREELLGRYGSELRSEANRDRGSEHLNRALAEGTAVVEAEHVLATGETVPVEISTRSVELEGHTFLIAIVRDLRERKEAEAALRKTEERYRTLVENLPDLIARFDRQLVCQFVSATGAHPSPLGTGEPVGRPLRELGLVDPVLSRLEAALRVAFETGETQELELASRRSADDRTFDWRVVPEQDDEGRVTSVVVIARETTERRALEQQLRQSQKMEAVGRLAGGVAHDFNNIITSIQGHAAMVLDELDPEQSEARDLEEIIRSAQRAAALTGQLLAFSRQQILKPRKVDLGETVRDMESMLRRLIGEDIGVSVEIPRDGNHTTLADPSQLEQILLNLVVNARDAMPDGGRLTLRVDAADWPGLPPDVEDGTGEAVRLSVADSGIGMDPETVERIFEPFFTTKEAEKGTGLGLSTVYGIVEQTRGMIEVESEPGRGTRVDVFFPAVAPLQDGTDRDAPPEASPPARTGGLVLLVEDESGVRGLARRVLEKEGYRVLEARSGDEALERLRSAEEPPDLVLTDMVMPGLDGRELAARVRRECPGCKVLLMSGYTEDVVVREQQLNPETLFLAKPFTPEELIRQVANALAGRGDPG